MVLGDEIEQHGCFLLHTGIEFLTSECLVNLPNTAFERIVFLIAKQDGASEFLAQSIDSFHRILVCSMERLFLGRLVDSQPLVIIVVEGYPERRCNSSRPQTRPCSLLWKVIGSGGCAPTYPPAGEAPQSVRGEFAH